jgi:hypothetical protein
MINDGLSCHFPAPPSKDHGNSGEPEFLHKNDATEANSVSFCERCNETLELCLADYPFNEDYWICPKCESTYPLTKSFVLDDEDRDHLLQSLKNPSPPNENLKEILQNNRPLWALKDCSCIKGLEFYCIDHPIDREQS